MKALLQDIQYGFRALRKHRGFAVVAMLTFALGIGVNAALFAVFDAFVLKPLPLKDPAGVMGSVRELGASIDPSVRTAVRRIDDSLAFQTAPFRAIAWLSSALGILALLLASVGLYGVMSFVVARQTREIGIRVALGATPTDVVQMFLVQGMRLIGMGMVAGLAIGALVSRLLSSVLIDLSSLDPITFGGVSLFLALVGLIAIFLPARRGTKVDPLQALRYE
jgi:putative ABC transport system permease protein